MTNNKLQISILLIPLVFIAAGCNKKPTQPLFGSGTATVAGHIITVEVARTVLAQAQGLSNRDFLAENNGMLFIFSSPSRVAFWMKDTKIPLDFIWIKDGKVVEITKNVQPEPNLPDASLHRYLPAELIDSTIEVNAGWATKNKVKVHDSVRIDANP
jgi:hypothetical protein